jgi:hypothetical protein
MCPSRTAAAWLLEKALSATDRYRRVGPYRKRARYKRKVRYKRVVLCRRIVPLRK